MNITDECTGAHHGQIDATICASDALTGEYRGHLDYSYLEAPGENILIKWVEVPEEFRGQGIATQLVKELQANNPDRGIDWGYMTEEGIAFQEAVAHIMWGEERWQNKISTETGHRR